MIFKLKKPDMVHEAAQTGGKNVFVEILMFLGVYIVVQLFMMVPILGGEIILLAMNPDFMKISMSGDMDALMALEMEILNSEGMMVLQLFATTLMIAIPMLFCKLIQKRKMRTLGFKKAGMWKEYGLGLLIGFAMMTGIVLIGMVTGALTLQFNSGLLSAAGIGMLLLLFVGFLIQGMSEEVFCRSYFLVSIARKKGNVWLGIIVNALAFGALHLGNPGITALSMVNLVLFGIFASIYFVKRGSIWGVAAIHSIWNFAQGNVYGILVSGMDFGTTIFKSTINEEMTLINGGTFGLEGGILTTIVLVVATVLTLMSKQKDFVEE